MLFQQRNVSFLAFHFELSSTVVCWRLCKEPVFFRADLLVIRGEYRLGDDTVIANA